MRVAQDRVLAAVLEEVASFEHENGLLRARARTSVGHLQSTVTELGLMLWAAQLAEKDSEDAAAEARARG